MDRKHTKRYYLDHTPFLNLLSRYCIVHKNRLEGATGCRATKYESLVMLPYLLQPYLGGSGTRFVSAPRRLHRLDDASIRVCKDFFMAFDSRLTMHEKIHLASSFNLEYTPLADISSMVA